MIDPKAFQDEVKRRQVDTSKGMETVFQHVSPPSIRNRPAHNRAQRKRAQANLSTKCEQLRTILSNHDAIELLSSFSLHAFGGPDMDLSEWDRPQRALQHHVELLQGLLLSQPYVSTLPRVTPDNITDLTTLFQSLLLDQVIMSATNHDPDDYISDTDHLNFTIRQNTSIIRNWAGHAHTFDLYHRVFSTIDADFRSALGVSATDIISTWDLVTRHIVSSIHQHSMLLDYLSRLTHPLAKLDAVRSASLVLPHVIAPFWSPSASTKASQADLQASMDDIVRMSQVNLFVIDKSRLQRIVKDRAVFTRFWDLLSHWSTSLGALPTTSLDNLQLANEVWDKPFIQISSSAYMLPIPGIFNHFGFRLMESLMKPHKSLMTKYSTARSRALEASVTSTFRSHFPSGSVYSQIYWKDSLASSDLETDMLLILDSFAIIVESKSGRVPSAALRGGMDSLRTASKGLVEASANQSLRLARLIAESSGVISFRDGRRRRIDVDVSRVRSILRLNAILEPIGSLHSHWNSLLRTGMVSQDAEPTPTLLVTDIETVLSHLETEHERLHYLLRRGELEYSLNFIGDEEDLLGLYISSAFDFPDEILKSDSMLWSTGDSAPLDRYYHELQSGREPDKPQRKLSKWWLALLARINAVGGSHATEASTLLLRFGLERQLAAEFQLDAMIHTCMYEFESNPAPLMLISTVPGIAVGFVVFRRDMHTRTQKLDAMGEAALRAHNAAFRGSSLVIAIEATNPLPLQFRSRPYDMFALYPEIVDSRVRLTLDRSCFNT